MKPKVLCGITSRGSRDIRPELFNHIIEELLNNKDVDFKSMIFGVSGYSAGAAQHKLFFDALEEPWDYLWIIDSDVVPGPGTLSKLVACDKDLVTAPVWHYDETVRFHLNVHYPQKGVVAPQVLYARLTASKSSGVEEIVSSSFGCLLIKRKVLETFVGKAETFTECSPLTPEFKDMFTDNIFFAKAMRMGFKAYVCWDAKGAVHYKTLRLTEDLMDKYVRELVREHPERLAEIVRGKHILEEEVDYGREDI